MTENPPRLGILPRFPFEGDVRKSRGAEVGPGEGVRVVLKSSAGNGTSVTIPTVTATRRPEGLGSTASSITLAKRT